MFAMDNLIYVFIFLSLATQSNNYRIGFKLDTKQFDAMSKDKIQNKANALRNGNIIKGSTETILRLIPQEFQDFTPFTQEPVIPSLYFAQPSNNFMHSNYEEIAPVESYADLNSQPILDEFVSDSIFSYPQIPIFIDILPPVNEQINLIPDNENLKPILASFSQSSSSSLPFSVTLQSPETQNSDTERRNKLLIKFLEILLDTLRSNITEYKVYEDIDETDNSKNISTSTSTSTSSSISINTSTGISSTSRKPVGLMANNDDSLRELENDLTTTENYNKIDQINVSNIATLLRNFTDNNGNLCYEELISAPPRSFIKITCEEKGDFVAFNENRQTTTYRSNVTFYTKELTTEKAKLNVESTQIDVRKPLSFDDGFQTKRAAPNYMSID